MGGVKQEKRKQKSAWQGGVCSAPCAGQAAFALYPCRVWLCPECAYCMSCLHEVLRSQHCMWQVGVHVEMYDVCMAWWVGAYVAVSLGRVGG